MAQIINGKYIKELDELTSILTSDWLPFQPEAVSNQAYRIKLSNFIKSLLIVSEVPQQVTITNANATDALVLDGNASVIEITLDAALTQDWKPASITGIVPNRSYLFVIIKESENGVDMSATTGAHFDDDIDAFANLIDITLVQKRAVVPAVGLKSTAIQFTAMIITGSGYVE